MFNGHGAVCTISTATGAATLAFNIGRMARHGDFDPVTGLYYGIDSNTGSARNLVRVNTATQLGVDVLPSVSGLHTLTFASDAVPEPSTVVLAATGLMLVVLRARRRSS